MTWMRCLGPCSWALATVLLQVHGSRFQHWLKRVPGLIHGRGSSAEGFTAPPLTEEILVLKEDFKPNQGLFSHVVLFLNSYYTGIGDSLSVSHSARSEGERAEKYAVYVLKPPTAKRSDRHRRNRKPNSKVRRPRT